MIPKALILIFFTLFIIEIINLIIKIKHETNKNNTWQKKKGRWHRRNKEKLSTNEEQKKNKLN